MSNAAAVDKTRGDCVVARGWTCNDFDVVVHCVVAVDVCSCRVFGVDHRVVCPDGPIDLGTTFDC